MNAELVTIEANNLIRRKLPINDRSDFLQPFAFCRGEFYMYHRFAESRYDARLIARDLNKNLTDHPYEFGTGIQDVSLEEVVPDNRTAAVWAKTVETPRVMAKRILKGWRYE